MVSTFFCFFKRSINVKTKIEENNDYRSATYKTITEATFATISLRLRQSRCAKYSHIIIWQFRDANVHAASEDETQMLFK